MIYTLDKAAFDAATPEVVERLRHIAGAMQARFHDLAMSLAGKPEPLLEAFALVDQLRAFALEHGYEQWVTALPGAYVLAYPVVLTAPDDKRIALLYEGTPPYTAAKEFGWVEAQRPKKVQAN